MVKPFTGAHLDARMAAVLRRAGRASREDPRCVESAALRVDWRPAGATWTASR